jgi:hypothetical protein
MLSSYDNWKLESPHEGETCPHCGEMLDEYGYCPDDDCYDM